MHLKVDVESGKLIIKKSKDGSEDKFYSHKKSKPPIPPNPATHVLCSGSLWEFFFFFNLFFKVYCTVVGSS